MGQFTLVLLLYPTHGLIPVLTNILMGLPYSSVKIAIESGPFLVSFPIKQGDFMWFSIVMIVYQRVNLHFPMVFLWFSH